MRPLAYFQASTRLVFGEGSLSNIGEVLEEGRVSRPLIITDGGMIRTGLIDNLIQILQKTGCDVFVFSEVETDPCVKTVAEAGRRYQEYGCDGLLAVGGGSPMDCAKATGVLASHPGNLGSYFGIGKVVNPLPPLIAVPSTVGTGSEVTPFAVISDREESKKKVIGSPLLAPCYAILDPRVVESLPEQLVATTGMDALTHAVESVISLFSSPFSDALALEAIRLISIFLPAALQSSGHKAKGILLYASTMAGQAFSYARTGLVHGMAHPVGSYYHLHHGLAVAILLPYVLSFNQPFCDSQLARVGAAMGVEASSEAAIEAVIRLKAEVGIPEGLSEAGVTHEFLAQMARDAFESGNAQVVNPRKPTLEDVTALYQEAL